MFLLIKHEVVLISNISEEGWSIIKYKKNLSKRTKNKFFFNWEHPGFKNLWTSQEFNSIKPLDIRVSKQTRQVLVTQFPEKLSLSI